MRKILCKRIISLWPPSSAQSGFQFAAILHPQLAAGRGYWVRVLSIQRSVHIQVPSRAGCVHMFSHRHSSENLTSVETPLYK